MIYTRCPNCHKRISIQDKCDCRKTDKAKVKNGNAQLHPRKGSHFVGAFTLGASYERIRQIILQFKEMESLSQFVHTVPNND